MCKHKQVQSIALGVAMLVAGTAAAAINVSVPPQQRVQVAQQLDVPALMSHSRNLPVDFDVSP